MVLPKPPVAANNKPNLQSVCRATCRAGTERRILESILYCTAAQVENIQCQLDGGVCVSQGPFCKEVSGLKLSGLRVVLFRVDFRSA